MRNQLIDSAIYDYSQKLKDILNQLKRKRSKKRHNLTNNYLGYRVGTVS